MNLSFSTSYLLIQKQGHCEERSDAAISNYVGTSPIECIISQRGDTALQTVKCLAESPVSVTIVKLAKRGFDPNLPMMTMRYLATLTAEDALRIHQGVEFDE